MDTFWRTIIWQQYTKDELQSYLDHCRQKCQATLETLTDEKARQRCKFSWGEVSFAELLLEFIGNRNISRQAAKNAKFLREKS